MVEVVEKVEDVESRMWNLRYNNFISKIRSLAL